MSALYHWTDHYDCMSFLFSQGVRVCGGHLVRHLGYLRHPFGERGLYTLGFQCKAAAITSLIKIIFVKTEKYLGLV